MKTHGRLFSGMYLCNYIFRYVNYRGLPPLNIRIQNLVKKKLLFNGLSFGQKKNMF